MKRAQEMRIDEVSRYELREGHVAVQELTSQIHELQERMIYINDSGEFQDVEPICSGKLSQVPSQLAKVPSLGGMLSRNQVCDLIQGICLVHWETRLTVHVQKWIRYRHLIKECFTLGMIPTPR